MAGNELTILAEGPFAPEMIDVTWAEAAAIPREAQAYIEERWAVYMAAAKATGRTLFNAPVTRLVSVRAEGGRLALVLGPTDYKTFVVTTLRDRPWFEEHAPEAMTPAVGNSVLLTQGDRALLGVRSQKTSAYGGRAHLIGGVLDVLGSGELGVSAEGLLAHLRKELLEEAGLLGTDLVELPRLLAVARDEFLAQPELIWQWETGADVERVGERLERAEHDGYEIVNRTRAIQGWPQNITPVALTALHHWKNKHG